MVRNFAHKSRLGFVAVAVAGFLLAQTAPTCADSSISFPPSLTNPSQITPDTLELPQIGFEGSEACDNSPGGMADALNSAGNYTVNQQFQITQGYLRQPTSYFQCLQPLLSAANKVINAFNDGPGNIGSLFDGLLKKATDSLLSNLETAACAAVEQVMGPQISGYVQIGNLYGINTALGTPVTAISGASQGTSVNNMVGNAPAAVAPTASVAPSGAQAADSQSGSMVMAQDTAGTSLAELNSPAPTPDAKRYGPHTPKGYSSARVPPHPTVNDEDWTPDANSQPDPKTATPAPAPPPFKSPALPPASSGSSIPSTPSNPVAAGTNTHGGVMAVNWQNFVVGRVYGKKLQCVMMFRTPSPPSLGNLGPFGEYPQRAPIHPGDLVQGLTDLSPGVLIATFLGPGQNFNTPQVYGHQHIAMNEKQDLKGVYVLNQYRKSGGARIDLLRWTSGVSPDFIGNVYHVVLK